MAQTAIAILNFNGKEHLQKFLPTLIEHSIGYPIFIGDNASTDDSVAYIKATFPEIQLLEFNTNYGYSKGYNMLLKEIKADYVALINSDIEVTSNWLVPLIDEIERNNSIAAVQPKIKSYNTKENFEYAGAAGGFIDTYGYPYCRGRIFNTIEKDHGQYDNSITIDWASGACFLVRKSAFDIVGSFDDDFFAHMEEIDLCWRLSNYGYNIKYTSASVVYHVGGGTLAYESPFKTYLNFRNGLYLLIKNLPKHQLAKKILIRVLLDWLSLFYFLLQGKWQHSKAIFKAHNAVIKNRRHFLSKRYSKINTIDYGRNYSIVWKYFVENKKKYTQL